MRMTVVLALSASALLAQRPSRTSTPAWAQVDSGLPRSPAGVRALVADPSTPSTIYALAYGSPGYSWGNVFKSTDGGGSWNLVSGVSAVGSLVIDPGDSSTLYAVSHGTVLKSTDGGQNWSGAGAGVLSPTSLAIDPQNPSTLYATGSGAIFKTTDGGASWSTKSAPSSCCGGQIAIDPSNSSTIYINTGSGIVKSTDGGESWRTLVSTQGGCNCPLAIDPARPSTLYAVYLSASEWNLYKSIDGGETWTAAHNGIPARSFVTSILFDTTTATIYASYLVGDPTGGVVKSTDGGANWSVASFPPNAPPVHSLALNPANPSTLLAGYFDLASGRGGVFRSTDRGANWNDASAGLEFVDIHALAIDPASRATVYAAAADGVSKSVDSGRNWSTVHFPTPGPGTAFVPSLLIDSGNPNVLYASVGSTGGCIYTDYFLRKSTDGGATWSNLPANYCFFGGNVPLAMHPGDSNTLYATPEDEADCGTPLDTTNDGGTTWTTTYIDGYVTALAIDPSNPSTLYTGTSGWPRGVLKSSDGGKTWVGTALKNVDVTVLALDPANSNILYAGTTAPYPDGTPGMFKSADGGATWSAITKGLEEMVTARAPIAALAMDPKLSILYLGTSGRGVFRSGDGGATWTPLNDGLPNLYVRALAVSSDGSGTVYAGTASGVFRFGGNARIGTFRR